MEIQASHNEIDCTKLPDFEAAMTISELEKGEELMTTGQHGLYRRIAMTVLTKSKLEINQFLASMSEQGVMDMLNHRIRVRRSRKDYA